MNDFLLQRGGEILNRLMVSISFSEFMQRALYDPKEGYYARLPEVGKRGDFFTSVSVGSLFGQILAHQAFEVWKKLDYPESFTIAEQGAHTGDLMYDLLQELRILSRECFQATKVLIIEPFNNLQRIQKERLRSLQIEVEHSDSWSKIPPNSVVGFFFCNELLDSFPVDLVVYREGEWKEKCVKGDRHEGYGWEEVTLDSKKQNEILDFPKIEGYTTELHRSFDFWVPEIFAAWKRGFFFDGGLRLSS